MSRYQPLLTAFFFIASGSLPIVSPAASVTLSILFPPSVSYVTVTLSAVLPAVTRAVNVFFAPPAVISFVTVTSAVSAEALPISSAATSSGSAVKSKDTHSSEASIFFAFFLLSAKSAAAHITADISGTVGFILPSVTGLSGVAFTAEYTLSYFSVPPARSSVSPPLALPLLSS